MKISVFLILLFVLTGCDKEIEQYTPPEWFPHSIEPDISAMPDDITIVDGDTIKIGKALISLYGIDAPELTQTYRVGEI